MNKHTKQSFFGLLTVALLGISFPVFGTTNNWAQASSKQGNDLVYAQVIAQFAPQSSKSAEVEKTNPPSEKKQEKREKSDADKTQDLPWTVTSATFGFVVLLYLGVLRFYPLLLLRLPAEFKIPKTPITSEFPLPLGLVIWLKYRPRVLDAWVEKYIEIFNKRFLEHETVKERNDYYVSLPVKFNKEDIKELTVINLRETFKKEKRVRLMIWGEDAGSGKTTIACQIAQWAMIKDDKKRLNEGHLMLPVLIEKELMQSEKELMPLLRAIIGKIGDLINEKNFNDELLVKQLLQERRILLIVDHFSQQTHDHLKIDDPNFPANALLVTSRFEQKFQEGIDINIETLCFDGLRLESFIKQYLENRYNGEFLEEFAQERIVVNQQKTPVWLAKLYAERMINADNNLRGTNRYPDNIPDLIIDHLKKLNYDVVRRTNREYHTLEPDAKFIAWKCLEQNYKPTYIEKNSITPDIWGEGKFKIFLHRFEKELHLIRSGETDTIKFVLAPLAEYLAALYVVENWNKNEALCKHFLDTATRKRPEEIKSFLLAVRECCITKGAEANVPAFVAEELGRLAGLDPKLLRQQQVNRYIHQQLMALLNNDYRVRARATEALGKLGNTSKRVLLGLVKLLEDNDSYVRRCTVNALRDLGDSSKIVLQGLFERLRHDNSDVYNPIFTTLCELGRSSPEWQVSLLTYLGDNHESNTRSRAAKVLGRLGNPSREVLQALLQLLQSDPDFTVRVSGAMAFCYLAEALPTNLSDLSEVVLLELLEILPEILQALDLLFRDGNFSEAIEAERTLNRLRNLLERLRNLFEGD
ncbi:MAG: HEAT repeat domain-containing protein [Nostoc sp.]|uniref:HEAT repeat domain-containing protein n=1 Tax=Nostoc sp. TaxID=1180 RepID=UPI002FF51192